jgi:hypothetical protein
MATIAAESRQQIPVGFKGNPARGRQDMNPTLRFAHHVAKGTPIDLNRAGGIPAHGSLARPAAFKIVKALNQTELVVPPPRWLTFHGRR